MNIFINNLVPKDNEVLLNVLKNSDENKITYFDNDIEKQEEECLIVKYTSAKTLKDCPCTNYYRGCDYKVLHFGDNCPFECTYCILNAYFDSEDNVVYADVDSMVDECVEYLKTNEYLRLGTGEYTDSLAYENVTGFSKVFIEKLYARVDNSKISVELKTKSLAVNSLFDLKYKKNIVLAWSLNAETIQKQDELKTPSIRQRLEKAKLAVENGFKVSFHFDPIIYFDNWKEEYIDTVNMIFNYVPENKVAFISLGSFRFMPSLEKYMLKKYNYSNIMEAEFIKAVDGKMRYPYPLRREMFNTVYKQIRKYSNDIAVYFCMEGERAWNDVIGYYPKDDVEVGKMLWDAIVR